MRANEEGPLFPAFLGAYVTQDLADQVKAIAEQDDRSQAWVIRQALKRYVSDFAPDQDAQPSTGAAA